MGKAIDITGQKFNRLTAIKYSHKQYPRNHYWLYKCDCGREKIIKKSHVSGNKTTSCGCYSQDRREDMKLDCKSNHLQRYLYEFDFRYNTKDNTDIERTALLLGQAIGKRLTYKQ